MDEQRLAEIEAHIGVPCFTTACSCIDDDMRELIAEVRRLQRSEQDRYVVMAQRGWFDG